jgi:hypothetical protein
MITLSSSIDGSANLERQLSLQHLVVMSYKHNNQAWPLLHVKHHIRQQHCLLFDYYRFWTIEKVRKKKTKRYWFSQLQLPHLKDKLYYLDADHFDDVFFLDGLYSVVAKNKRSFTTFIPTSAGEGVGEELVLPIAYYKDKLVTITDFLSHHLFWKYDTKLRDTIVKQYLNNSSWKKGRKDI